MRGLIKILVSLLIFFSGRTYGQEKLSFFQNAPEPHKPRIIGVSAGVGVTYAGLLIGLNELWYAQFERAPFHFFDDSGEWLQVDKVGHLWTAYVQGQYGIDLYRWVGLERRKAVWIGGSMGSLFQTALEILDGTSARWGASWADLAANTAGTALLISQELAWGEQKIIIKFSSHKPDYSGFDPLVQQRVDDLYGTSLQERILKDYNGQSYWLSFNPVHVFNEQSKFPKWLNISLGYGAQNLFGGFDNTWEDEDGFIIDRTEIPRKRQYFLSLDINFRAIPTQSRWLKILFKAINILKVPAPALEINSQGKMRFHYMYW